MEPRTHVGMTIRIGLASLCILVLAGVSSAVTIPIGALDPTFGHDGKIRVSFGPDSNAVARDVLVYHGRTLAAGEVERGDKAYFALLRRMWNGERDQGFGGDGKVTVDFETASARLGTVGRYGRWRVIAAGSAGDDVALSRHRRDGTLDPTFGEAGKVLTEFVDRRAGAEDVLVQSDGKILIAARSSDSDFLDARNVIVRYEPDGSLDEAFGDGGVIMTERVFDGPDGTDEARLPEVELLPDGGLVAAGSVGLEGNFSPTIVARFNPDGTLDETFDGDGHARADHVRNRKLGIEDIAIDADGSIIVGGYYSERHDAEPVSFGLHRFTSDGSIDNTFSDDGFLSLPDEQWDSALRCLVLQPDGKIIAAGFTSRRLENEPRDSSFRIDRYTHAGVLDKSFGGDGIVRTGLSSGRSGLSGTEALDVELHPKGRIVAAGVVAEPKGDGFRRKVAITRYGR